MKRLLIMAAGTGGHIFPGLAIAETMQARGWEVTWLGTEHGMERDLVRHCFALRPVAQSETVEGIRALAVDKDHSPQWQPARAEDVDAAEVTAFFVSPWPPHAHPLRDLG